MKTLTIYVAFDDTEFETKKECIEYEDKARNILTLFTKAYEFYDENLNRILVESMDIGSMLDNICVAYDVGGFVFYTPKYFTHDIKVFNRNYLGFDLPEDEEEGMYKYNRVLSVWEKID